MAEKPDEQLNITRTIKQRWINLTNNHKLIVILLLLVITLLLGYLLGYSEALDVCDNFYKPLIQDYVTKLTFIKKI